MYKKTLASLQSNCKSPPLSLSIFLCTRSAFLVASRRCRNATHLVASRSYGPQECKLAPRLSSCCHRLWRNYPVRGESKIEFFCTLLGNPARLVSRLYAFSFSSSDCGCSLVVFVVRWRGFVEIRDRLRSRLRSCFWWVEWALQLFCVGQLLLFVWRPSRRRSIVRSGLEWSLVISEGDCRKYDWTKVCNALKPTLVAQRLLWKRGVCFCLFGMTASYFKFHRSFPFSSRFARSPPLLWAELPIWMDKVWVLGDCRCWSKRSNRIAVGLLSNQIEIAL